MTPDKNRPTYTRRHWAKAYPYRQRGPERIHLLEHHLADVGVCFEVLMRQPTMKNRLATAGGLPDLDESLVARLSVFAALHDIGKANVGFQTQVWRDDDFGEKRKPGRAGHTADVVPVLTGDDYTTFRWFSNALGWDDFLTWDDRGGETVCAMLVATLSHHGRPLQLENRLSKNPAIWRPFGELNPEDCVRRIGRLMRRWFPAAFAPGATSLPSDPHFQHMFLGLCTLADWIGSDEGHFGYCDQSTDDYIHTARKNAKRAMRAIGLDIQEQSSAFRPLPDFAALFEIDGGKPPNAIQNHAALKTPLEESVVIIESETGSGKTEAALWRFAKMYQKGLVDGLYFALPTRVSASQMYDRVNHFTKQMFPDGHQPIPVLAVPGYIRAGDFTGKHLPDYQVMWEDRPNYESRARRWAAESAKRFLAAQIAVGTVDQAMMGALQVRHSHMRTACLARNLLVVDEVHASDPYMRVIIEQLLNAHVGAGGYALLMSATLGSEARRRWLSRPRRADQVPTIALNDAIDTPYPSIATRSASGERVVASGENDQNKRVRVHTQPTMHQSAQVAECALEAARSGGKVIIIRNTVANAVDTHQAIEQATHPNDPDLLFTCNGVPTLHTGRFAAEDRKMLDEEVQTQIGKYRPPDGGRVVVGTQTLEQSLDIDADLLITDLCPMDVLLQRIGRLHRHPRDDRPSGYAEPRCIVLMPPTDDLSSLRSSKEGAPNSNGLGSVYPDLRVLELTRRLIVEYSRSGEPWNIPEMNRELVERTTHSDALDMLVGANEDWIEHRNKVDGGMIADGITAKLAVVRRDTSFLDNDVVFADVEEKIRTRLGDEGIKVDLYPLPSSPFDAAKKIDTIRIPGHMSIGLSVDAPIAPNVLDGGGFKFAVEDRGFKYDRLGLRRV